MFKKFILDNKKNIIDIISALLIFVLMKSYLITARYNILDLFFIGMCYIFCSKVNLKSSTTKKDVLIIAFILSTFFQIGNVAIPLKGTQLSLYKEFFNIKNLIWYLGTFVLFYKGLCWLYPKILNFKVLEKKEKNINYKLKALKIFLILMLFWLPYFFICYPGILSPDSIYEFRTIMTDFATVSNAHPIFHTIFVYIFYSLGKFIFNDINAAVACVTMVQLILMALMITYGIIFLYKRNVKKVLLNSILLFYGIVPIFGIYGICMWKDILFAGFMLLFVLICIEMQESKKITIKMLIKFFVFSLLVIFFRNNAIYMYLILLPIMFYYFKGNNKKVMPVMIISIIIYFIVTGPVFKTYNVQKSNTVEYLGVPIQHISRMVYKNVDLSKKDEKLLNEMLPIDLIKENYNPGNADNIKFNSKFNQDVLVKKKTEYLKLYLRLLIRNPHIAVEEEFYLTTRYWYPNVNIEVLGPFVKANDYGIHATNLAPEWLYRIYRIILDDDTLLFTLSWSSALYTWVLFINFIIAIRKNKKLLPYWILIAYVFTLIIGAPLSTIRYYYCIYVITPILIFYPYLKSDKIIKEIKSVK